MSNDSETSPGIVLRLWFVVVRLFKKSSTSILNLMLNRKIFFSLMRGMNGLKETTWSLR